MWLREIVQMAGDVHFLAKHVVAIGRFDVQNIAVVKAELEPQ